VSFVACRYLCIALVAVLALAGCSSAVQDDRPPPAAAPSGHSHDHGAVRVSLPVGDGTDSYEVGYTLRDLQLPQEAGEPGQLSFVVERYDGRPQTRFLEEQTKRMHVYVVRDDLAVFRHVHPEMDPDGTWTGNLTLPEPGDYRLVAEFVARDDGGNGDHVILGDVATVAGEERAGATAPVADASGWGVGARVVGDVVAGPEQQLRVRLTRPDGPAPVLDDYLGTSAHLTGFHVETGGAVHMHPLGEPVVDGDGTELLFHAELPHEGEYVLFLQARVDDFLHTVRLPVTAA
jgi:hypothetical protein